MPTIIVAGVQATSRSGQAAANLAEAEPLVAEAARQGAQLVLCPELLAPGYLYHRSIWDGAEPRAGLTEAWLGKMAARFGITIGASYLEFEDTDFFNTFALAEPPRGAIAGRVRKASIPAFEGWYVRPSAGPKIIECRLGRIGVGICHDNATAAFFNQMAEQRPDLILMPYSAPAIDGGIPFAATIASLTCEQVARIGAFYARSLGIPTLLVNKAAAPLADRSPLPLLPGVRVGFEFRGQSGACAADGKLLQQLDERPGVVIARLELDPTRKRRAERLGGYWALAPSRLARLSGWLMRALDALGRRAYRFSRKRREAAAAASRVTEGLR